MMFSGEINTQKFPMRKILCYELYRPEGKLLIPKIRVNSIILRYGKRFLVGLLGFCRQDNSPWDMGRNRRDHMVH